MVEKGMMVLYPNVRPALRAGRYEITLEQTFRTRDGNAIPDVGDVAPVTKHIDVTAPRFSMPGSEVFSVYPPPNAEGAFSTRLPQIVLKRRTLPWERKVAPDEADDALPWLALVVLSEGEANFRRNISIEEALPEEVRVRIGVTESGSCDVIEVPERVIGSVFPAKEEVKLLCHVREVNISDTEYADQDGWVSVVISNRLPQPGISYRAYLISLEGLFDLLPENPPVQEDIGLPLVFEAAELANMVHVLAPVTGIRAGEISISAASLQAGNVVASLDPSVLEAVSHAQSSGFLVHAIDFSLIDDISINTTHNFPVLASWDFACEEGGDFQYLMENLDVGLVGTAPKSVDPEDVRERVSVAPTGHSFLEHLTRRGQQVRSWYRSPLVPREVERRAAQPFHVADQARRISEDGFEDLSEAAAFEVGRLLALSDQRFLALLHAWRRRTLVTAIRKAHLGGLVDLGEITDSLQAIARKVDLHVLSGMAGDLPAKLSPIQDPFGVGDLLDPNPASIATGLGVVTEVVADALAAKITTVPLDLNAFQVAETTAFDRLAADPGEIRPLAVSLENMKASLVLKAQVVPIEPGPVVGPIPSGPILGPIVRPPVIDVPIDRITTSDDLLGVLWPRLRERGAREEER